MKSLINKIIEVMDCKYEVDVSMYTESFIQKMINARCEKSGLESCSDYILHLSSSVEESKILKQSLINNYTDFFRDDLTYANIEKWVLPQVIKNKPINKELRIWSAGCSSGQEPYSIAMLLESYYNNEKTLRYRIFATDISNSALNKAQKGEYSENDVRNIKIRHLNDFFTRNGDTYKIIPKLKNSITFSSFDMLDKNAIYPQESIFGNFDMVFCNNLLIYFRPEHQQYILKKLIRSLSDTGYLITGEAECEIIKKSHAFHLALPNTTIFQKIHRGES